MKAPTAQSILEAGIAHMRERARTYDKPQGERSMWATVAAFNAITGLALSEEQGWMFLALLKIVRSQQGQYRADNYEDLSAYAGLMGEAAWKERIKPVYGPAPTEVPEGFLPWPGIERPESGLVQIINRSGHRILTLAEKVDWHRDDASPMYTDVMFYRRIVDGTEQPAPFYRSPPSWDDAPEGATHLVALAAPVDGYMWGSKGFGDTFFDADQLPELVFLDSSLWIATSERPKKISAETLANSCAAAQ